MVETKPYQVLARKYRPTTFDGLMGQDVLVNTLKGAITLQRLPHALLLTGIRGTGKTTTARIIAKAINCVGPDGQGNPTPNPCGVCEHCRAIGDDRHLDVLEMDAASRTGVDDVREIIDAARYKAVTARYKVYIIDEVHMLTKHAFNALLKTLEEPPPQVLFIFATTEIRRVPDTILSRCMRFDLKRLEAETLVDLFRRILTAEGADADDESLALIARAADGSARDGISILDQGILYCDGNLTGAGVRSMLGLCDRLDAYRLLDCILRGDGVGALSIHAQMYQAGASPLAILEDVQDIIHALSRMAAAGIGADPVFLTGLSATQVQQAQTWSTTISMPTLLHLWQVLGRGIADASLCPNSHQGAEMALLRACYLSHLPAPRDVIERLARHRAQGDEPAQVAPTPVREAADVGVKAAESARSTAGPVIDSFQSIVELVHQQRELMLENHLKRDVHCVHLSGTDLRIALTPAAPKNLGILLQKKLNDWTGAEWSVTVCDLPVAAGGEKTLYEQQKEKQAQMRQALLDQPLVQEALTAFPGAEIELVDDEVAR